MSENNIGSVIIITKARFPIGNDAAVVHLTHFIRAISLKGVKVEVICIGQRNENKGDFSGVVYYHKKKSLSSKFGLDINLKEYRELNNALKQKRFDVGFVYGDLGVFDIITPVVKKYVRKLVLLRSEFPFVFNSAIKRYFYTLYYRLFVLNLFDGFFTVSFKLESYYKKMMKNCKRSIVIPFFVDVDEFKGYKRNENYFFYCGALGKNQNGVPMLIDAFAKIAKRYSRMNLVLAGFADNKTLGEINKQILELNLDDRVQILLDLERSKLVDLMIGSKALILAKPNHLQAQGSFPSKLGEYLATGIPTVTTPVGDIPNYLSSKNAYISDTATATDVAKKMEEVLLDYDKARLVAREGTNVANKYDYRQQAIDILKFLEAV